MNLILDSVAFLAGGILFLAGLLVSIFGAPWRRPFQKCFAALAWLCIVPLAAVCYVENLPAIPAAVAYVVCYAGLLSLTVTTRERAWMQYPMGTGVVVQIDEGGGWAWVTRLGPSVGRPFSRGERVQVRIKTSLLFGWRTSVAIV